MDVKLDHVQLLCIFISVLYYVFCVLICFIVRYLESHESEMGGYIDQINKYHIMAEIK